MLQTRISQQTKSAWGIKYAVDIYAVFFFFHPTYTSTVMLTLGNFSHFRVIYPSDRINFVPIASNFHLHLNSLFSAFLCFFLSRCHQAVSIYRTDHLRIPDGILFFDSGKLLAQGMLFIIRCNPKGDEEGQSSLKPCPRRPHWRNATARPQENHKAPKAVIVREWLDIAILSVQDKWASVGFIFLANICAV